jgi:WD40 repeat protein
MKALMYCFVRIANYVLVTVILLFVNASYADSDRPDDSSVAGVSSPSAELPLNVTHCQPRVNHHSLILQDGRLLVAGGMPISNTRIDRNIAGATEIWSPKTGEWQSLIDELTFDADQKVYLNQLKDGRVLFFSVRERGLHEKPQYQAKIWEPGQNKINVIEHNLKPKRETDIAVLSDGRVLLVNGADASADLWNSQTGAMTHYEVAELENSRWRLLPLRNGKILAIAELSSRGAIDKKRMESSEVLVWDTQSDDWLALQEMPLAFVSSSVLLEMNDGTVQAKVEDKQLQLPALDKNWLPAVRDIQPELCKEADTTMLVMASNVSASQDMVPGTPTVITELSWKDNFLSIWGDSKWLLLALVVPLLLYSNIRRLKESQQEILLKFTSKLFKLIAFCIFIYFIFVALWALGNTMLQANKLNCGPYEHDSKSLIEPFEELKKFSSCVDDKNGALESMLFYKTKKQIMSIPSVPCRYVGEWISTRSIGKYKIKLTDDSRFVARALQGDQNVVSTGSWAVVNDEILWFYDRHIDPNLIYEANTVLSESMQEFTVVEENGERTVFKLDAPIQSSN